MARSDIFNSISRQIEDEIAKAFFGTRAATPEPQEPLTLEKLTALLEELPPVQTWVASALLAPRGSGLIVDTPDEKFICFHADDYPRIMAEWRKTTAPENLLNPLYGLNPKFIDPDPLDDPEQAKWRAKERERIYRKIGGAIQGAVELGEIFAEARRRKAKTRQT